MTVSLQRVEDFNSFVEREFEIANLQVEFEILTFICTVTDITRIYFVQVRFVYFLKCLCSLIWYQRRTKKLDLQQEIGQFVTVGLDYSTQTEDLVTFHLGQYLQKITFICKCVCLFVEKANKGNNSNKKPQQINLSFFEILVKTL